MTAQMNMSAFGATQTLGRLELNGRSWGKRTFTLQSALALRRDGQHVVTIDGICVLAALNPLEYKRNSDYVVSGGPTNARSSQVAHVRRC